jgi:phage protein D/phage baseplate assembly protein gpV
MSVATTPSVLVELGGQRLKQQFLRRLAEVRVRQGLSLPTLCELRFHDTDPAFTPTTVDAIGASLRVAVGGIGSLFDGDVTAVEFDFQPDGGRVLCIRGYDVLHRLRKRQPVRSHVQVTAADLARELVADLSLDVAVDDPGPMWERVFQYGQSDWQLLEDVAGRSGIRFFLRDRVLRLMTLAGVGPDIPLSLGDSLLEARLEVNAESVCRSVSAFAWGPLLAEEWSGRAERARTGREVAAEASPGRVGGGDERTLVDLAVEDATQAESFAQAALDHSVATEVVLRGVAEGDSRLGPGCRVAVAGVGERLSGRYVLTEVEHLVDDQSGYVTRFSTAPPQPTPRPRAATVVLAEVSGLGDPEGLGRVKVTLPAFDGLETGWVGVVTAGAGAGKGLVALPDVGDRVLLLCPGGDPVHGIVLGGLYGPGGAPDETVSSAGVRRYTFVTPGRQRIRLDDEANTVTMENAEGSLIEIGPEAMILRARVPLTIEAPGQPVRVRGASIDFERG